MEGAKKPLDEIMSFFTGNPFSTPVGHKIEEATDPGLASENWGANMEICDLINNAAGDDTAKEAVRAIRKRLSQFSGKNYTVIMFTLTVLETCVKNCSTRFHVLVCHKDFIQELVKLIGPKNDPPAIVQEKILGLIQSWATAFEGQPELSGVVQVYQDLKSKGIEFPMTDLDAMAPIFTPKRSVDSSEPILHQVDLGERQIKPSADQISKIRRDLDLVQANMAVFAEMLSEMKPMNENPQDLELIQELYTTCKEMQRRIADLLCTISSDELTAEMLHINDELNNLFLRYGRYRKNVEKTGTTGAMSPQSPMGNESEPSLIDFGSPEGVGAAGTATAKPDVISKLGSLGIKDSKSPTVAGPGAIKKPNAEGDDSEFDMFAQSRTATYEKSKTSGSSYADNKDAASQRSTLGAIGGKDLTEEEIMKSHRQSDFDEMEAWLEANPKPGSEKSLTSSEFDKFLQERAATVGQGLSSSPGGATGGSSATGASAKDREKTENKMFGL